MKGEPVGSAFAHITLSYAELTLHLTRELDDLRFGKIIDASTLAQLWIAAKEMENYIITGDPAARLSINMGATD